MYCLSFCCCVPPTRKPALHWPHSRSNLYFISFRSVTTTSVKIVMYSTLKWQTTCLRRRQLPKGMKLVCHECDSFRNNYIHLHRSYESNFRLLPNGAESSAPWSPVTCWQRVISCGGNILCKDVTGSRLGLLSSLSCLAWFTSEVPWVYR